MPSCAGRSRPGSDDRTKRVDSADGRALRRDPRCRHAAAPGLRGPPRGDDRPSAQPGELRLARRPGDSGLRRTPAAITSTLPAEQGGSIFQRIFSGSAGSIRMHPRSPDVYQDLLQEGSSPARHIRRRRLRAAMADRVPENALLSHDLFRASSPEPGS